MELKEVKLMFKIGRAIIVITIKWCLKGWGGTPSHFWTCLAARIRLNGGKSSEKGVKGRCRCPFVSARDGRVLAAVGGASFGAVQKAKSPIVRNPHSHQNSVAKPTFRRSGDAFY